MKLKTLAMMTATALLGTALATTSLAQPRSRGGFEGAPPRGEMPGPARGGMRGGPPGGAAAAQPERFIERHDTDADGRVSEAEFADERLAHVDEQFERRDSNGDGVISLEEHEAPRGRGPRASGERPARPAGDRPARPEIDREAVIACVRETIADFEPRFDDELEDAFENVDNNGDGELSLAEVSSAVEARANDLFARIDDNGDGYITESEVEAHFQAQLNVRRVTQDCVKEQLEG